MSLDVEQLERAVFEEIIELHPDHLTVAELVLRMSGERDEGGEIGEAIRDIKGCGLLRYVGDLVVPTHAAVRAAELLTPRTLSDSPDDLRHADLPGDS
jgi:hypothetical protein